MCLLYGNPQLTAYQPESCRFVYYTPATLHRKRYETDYLNNVSARVGSRGSPIQYGAAPPHVWNRGEAPVTLIVLQAEPHNGRPDHGPSAPGVQLEHLRHPPEPRQQHHVQAGPLRRVPGAEVARDVAEDVEHLLAAQAAHHTLAHVLVCSRPRFLGRLEISSHHCVVDTPRVCRHQEHLDVINQLLPRAFNWFLPENLLQTSTMQIIKVVLPTRLDEGVGDVVRRRSFVAHGVVAHISAYDGGEGLGHAKWRGCIAEETACDASLHDAVGFKFTHLHLQVLHDFSGHVAHALVHFAAVVEAPSLICDFLVDERGEREEFVSDLVVFLHITTVAPACSRLRFILILDDFRYVSVKQKILPFQHRVGVPHLRDKVGEHGGGAVERIVRRDPGHPSLETAAHLTTGAQHQKSACDQRLERLFQVRQTLPVHQHFLARADLLVCPLCLPPPSFSQRVAHPARRLDEIRHPSRLRVVERLGGNFPKHRTHAQTQNFGLGQRVIHGGVDGAHVHRDAHARLHRLPRVQH
mmetsp:Transcript_14422/g.35197  ORF Transcript_14422/g.35197 Transcript_14422/m.35197 type:complete len:524 (+) Transcript_14422:280-1851(+)